MIGAIPEIKVDQILIRQPRFAGHGFEVSHRVFIKPDGDGRLEELNVRVLMPLHF